MPGTPRPLPRQRTATQFVSEESVKICPVTGDLTYGLPPTNIGPSPADSCPLPGLVRARCGLWPREPFKLYCRSIVRGSWANSPSVCFPTIFRPLNAFRGVLMTAKRSSRALALLLALPSAAFALGMGDIRLLSPLNSPLNAEIELVDVAPDEANTVQAQLASRETFARNGLDWPGFLAGVQVRTVHGADGRTLITLKSTDPISEPFITLLVEVNWSHGRLVREYTMLLYPPVYTPGQSSAASAPVSAPSTGSGTREGAIARAAESAPSPPAAATPAATAASAPASATAQPSSPSAPPASSAAAPPASGARTSAASEGEGATHVVRRGETLSQIAAAAAGQSANTPRARSMMVAIYQGNPRAFEQNMNLLRTGAVLRMPDPAAVNAVSPGDALTEIRRETAAWRSAGNTSPATSTEQPGRLKLVTPSESPAAGATPGGTSSEVNSLQGRVHDLEGQLADSKRLLALKDADLARLQSQLSAKQAAPPQPTAPPQAKQPPAAQPPPQQQAPTSPPESTASAQPATPPASVTPPAEAPAEKAPEPLAQPPVAAKSTTKPVAQPSAGGSLMDTIKDYWWAVLIVVLAVVALLISRMVRSRRASEFDDSLGRLAVAGAGGAGPAPDFGSGGARFAPVETPPRSAAPGAAPEATFLVEESGSHERPRLGAAAAPVPTARHVASDDTISSDTAINLDQGDPLAEADFHMAYGLYDQAADLIRIAISREPARRDLKLKLLEVFFVWGNKDQFLQTARELAETRANAAPGEWEKIVIMGKQLAPEDPLFSSGGGISGATAGGVDLNLEGGQSRVDFDLLGEPVPGQAPGEVDLDIGSALGETAASSTLGTATDRNAAIDQSFTGSATGTTRQMTQKIGRTDDTALDTSMIPDFDPEAPTVEQPAISTPDNPT